MRRPIFGRGSAGGCAGLGDEGPQARQGTRNAERILMATERWVVIETPPRK
jgi:hypothetical protein